MMEAILQILAALVLFSSLAESQDDRELPAARVAVIGAGVGGCFAANFLRELPGGQNLDIHIWNKKGSRVGGRAATMEFAGGTLETGSFVIASSNKYLVDAVERFSLESEAIGSFGQNSLIGVFNGKNSAFQRGTAANLFKTLQPAGYGWSMDFFVNSWLKKFKSIYAHQASGKSFATVPDMLKAMGLYSLTQVTAKEHFVNNLGWSEEVVEELVMGAILFFYSQSVNSVNAFVPYYPLAALVDELPRGVVGGNWKIPMKVLQASGALLHKDEVTAVTRIENDGKVQYKLTTYTEGDVPGNFDVVIVANPLNFSKMKYKSFPTNVYTTSATTPYHRMVTEFIQGRINTEFFGISKNDKTFPNLIITTGQPPFEFCGAMGVNRIPVDVWAISTKEPMTDEHKAELFSEIKDQATFDWLAAVPEYQPPEQFPPFIIDDGVFYINTIEKAVSLMEMSAIGAKNVALLAHEYLLKSE